MSTALRAEEELQAALPPLARRSCQQSCMGWRMGQGMSILTAAFRVSL